MKNPITRSLAFKEIGDFFCRGKYIQMEEEERNEENNAGPEETIIPSLNSQSKRTIKEPKKFQNFQKWE